MKARLHCALLRVQVIMTVTWIFFHSHFSAQGIDAWIACALLFIIIGTQLARQQPDSDDIKAL